MSNRSSPVLIRSAEPADLEPVSRLIEPYVAQRKLLPRSTEELAALIRCGFVAEMEGRVVGFAAVEIYSRKLAEMLCLAVAEHAQGLGIGRQLVQACVDRARQSQVKELMAITSSEDFLLGCGFHFTLPDQRKALFIRTS